MLRLGLPREPRWLDLGYGVRLRVRPFNAAVLAAARSEAHALGRALRDNRAALLLAGLDPANLPDLEDEHVLAGVAETLLVKILARHVVDDWQGVLAADGSAAAPLNDATLGELLDIPAMAGAFLRQATEPFAALVAEGNGSGAAPSGTSAAAPDTAKGAGNTGSPAPEGIA
jgi:hypothetical protein